MSIIENAKEVAKLIQKIDNIELYKKILDLQGDITTLVQEKMELENQIKELSEKLSIKGSLEFREVGYWQKQEKNIEDGPFCTTCWDTDMKLIRLIVEGELYGCPICQAVRSKHQVQSLRLANFKSLLGNSRRR